MCKLVFRYLSQFFHNLRHFSSQAKDLSTIHLLWITANVLVAIRLAICTLDPSISCTPRANCLPVYPPSASVLDTFDNEVLCRWSASNAPFLSLTSAVVTLIAWGRPLMSTAICLFIPDTFLPASYPLYFAVSVFLTLWESIMRKLVFLSRPSASRISSTNFF